METAVATDVSLGVEDHTMVVEDVESGEDEDTDGAAGDSSLAKHTSVFDRLETDSRLRFSQKEMNFAKALGKEDTSALSFFLLASKDLTCIRIPKELATEVLKTHRATLYGYFLGPRLHFPVGENNQVVEAGPLMIRGVPLFVDHWDPTKGLVKPIHTLCHLWVKLHNVPLVAFNKEGISRIASALGIPKQMDACTTSMCDKSWGRPGFAKVLIETWAVGELKRELQVVIPSLSGGEESRVTINVEYDWEPTQCSHCMVFGHKLSSCVKALVAQKTKGKAQVVDDQGFTKVQRREWRPKPKPMEGSTSGTVPLPREEMTAITRIDVQEDDNQVQLGDTVDGGNGGNDVQLQGGSVLGSDEPPPVIPNPQQPPVVTMPRQESKPQEQPELRHFSAPLEVPLRTILKNTNRFSPLVNEGTRGDKGKEPVKGSNTSGKSVLDAPKKPGSTPRHPRHGKQDEVKNLIHLYNINICMVVETHVRLEMLSQVCKSTFGRWSWVSNQAKCTFGTRIILAWDPGLFDIMVIDMHAQCMHVQVRVRGSNCVFLMSCVYGANSRSDRLILWTDLRRFHASLGGQPWVLSGDFNALLFPHDALGGSSVRNVDMMDFADCIEAIEVFDIRYTGIHHTWCQKPRDESGIRRKLHRVMANISFTSMFANASVNFLPRGISDHSPSVLSVKAEIRKPRWGFKFDSFLVHHKLFMPIVSDVWQKPVTGSFIFQVTQKLKALKHPLRNLRNSYGDLHLRANKLKSELDVVQLAADFDPYSTALREDVEVLRLAYQKARLDEEIAVKQRAKVKWLREGDANTKFFHMVVKEKRHAQQIHSIRKTDATFVFDDDVPVAFVENLQALLGTRDDSLNPDMPAHFIGNEKAPGSDGFSASFFKAAWCVVGQEVTRAIHNFFYRYKLDKELNHTLLCLLPKSQSASSVTEYRPISCCTVLYKCISKILVDRIKPFLDGLVSNSQSGFIPGRRIVDNILMAHELVVGYHLQTGQPRCAFKIDIRKAYDMIDWRFLFSMLAGVGFHPALIRWIKKMVTTTSFSIALNGETHGFFKGARGIRQGDPLSPYLFTLVMEGFSMLFKECIREAAMFGYHPGCADLDITHLCFADDLFVFTGGDIGSVDVLKRALQLFSSKSGLSPSLEKRVRYLGVPLSPISLKVADYGGLVAKVKARICNWKTKFLSFGGRKQLVISVLQSLQLYWMAVFLFPSNVIHELEALCRDFLWAQGNSSRGKCKVAWDAVCKPLSCGGLGIKRLSVWNRALLAKHLWDICSCRDSLWVSWTTRIYVRQDSVWVIRPMPRWSWSFRKLLTLREEIRPYIRYQIGDGKTANAWEDNWHGTCLSVFISPQLIHYAGYVYSWKVADLVEALDGAWPEEWLSRFPQLFNVTIPVLTEGVPDRMIWDMDTNGSFSVRKAYVSLFGDANEVPLWKSVWFKGHIPKHAFCLWTACLRRLPTQDRISTWKHEPPDLLCSLCGTGQDSHNHFFFTCGYSKEVWDTIRRRIGWDHFPDVWDDIMDAISDPVTAPTRLILKLTLAAAVYGIWRERNRRLFGGERKTVQGLCEDIRDTVRMRVAWKTGISQLDLDYDDVIT
ncbi:hypothetical protein OSB04_019272 [Centaurea solstitialis]|uniref:Reverse transcriptase domain-containing protein n=1 Tax=Centaurea solstitialis TaxID=347529 RepID=A0AA38SRM7_9ASTR|nr:hypothetical protein OSB04_019272 [Centaurea solstitialis]